VAVVVLLTACGGDKDDDDAGGGAASDATGGDARGGGDAAGATGGSGEGGVRATGGSTAGGGDPGGSATGGSDPGGSDPGGSATGGSATGGSATGGSTAGGSDPGGSATGGSTTGGSTAGGSDPGGSATGGSGDAGDSDPGGSDAGGSATGGSGDAGGTSGAGGGTVDDAQACTDAGGTIETITCCETVADFPNRCHGADCTCSSAQEVLSCACPEGECFDGTTCVHDCGPRPDCNWCGGSPILAEDGCTVGYTCESGRDACSAAPCEDDLDCTTTGEECTDWGVCWAPTTTVTGEYGMVANPCTTDPCLPGMIYAILGEDQTTILLLRGQWIRYSSDWDVWPGVVPEVGDQVVARGDLVGGELLLTSLEIVE